MKTETQSPPAEQRILLHDISWESYEQILDALGENRAARLTYDQGRLEIMVPLEPHESGNRLTERFIVTLVEELGLNIKTMGSTTLNRPDLQKGSEPDSCYYIQNEPLVRGRIVNLNSDPPPDLVLEVDITHSDIDKLNLYARMGVSEFWRYNGEHLRIYQLQAGTYNEVDTSPTFPQVPKETLYRFLRECAQLGETQAVQSLRAWINKGRQQ
jgi:Uma2 family endonuclease